MLLPQDIVVLLKLAISKEEDIPIADLASSLKMSPSQVHESLRRARDGKLLLLDEARGRRRQNKRVVRLALLELLLHGARYVYQPSLGGETRGVPSFGDFAPTTLATGTWRD